MTVVQSSDFLAGTAPPVNSCMMSDVERRLDRCGDLKSAGDSIKSIKRLRVKREMLSVCSVGQ